MRYASYVAATGEPTWGMESDGSLHDLGPTGLNLAASLQDAIVNGDLPRVFGALNAPQQAVTGTTFLPVIDRPNKIICVGVNYRTHQEETGRADVVAPTIFARFADTLAAHGEAVPIPAEASMYDYEGEMALIIGAHADHVAAVDAYGIVSGYTAFNDFSARDWQRHTGQWTPGKNFPKSGTFGPYFVPAEDVPEVTELVVETRVNGDVRQHASVSDLIFDIPAIIEYVTTFTPLAPGDVIVTGTPGGVGLFMDPPTFLVPGDVVEVEITGLGVLSNTMVAT